MSIFRPGAPVSTTDREAEDAAEIQAAKPEQLLDDPQEWLAFGRPCSAAGSPLASVADALPGDPTSTHWESQVVLEGMYCAACALTIEDALRAVPGVLQADVSVLQ